MIQQQNEKILEQIDKSGELIVRSSSCMASAFCVTIARVPDVGIGPPGLPLLTTWDKDGEDL